MSTTLASAAIYDLLFEAFSTYEVVGRRPYVDDLVDMRWCPISSSPIMER